ncbi:DUF600 family protein [Jeotgalibacillus sp. S-D1]|uniref:antitoxin YezG family protein n=1 Tax=Jeotgalibacillus sp. S-D1 TaxID=2552189 RepID=UPI0010597214|nr:antitoxin YezG family protein [Jeotgalibacillus sp. S-D1]TDL32774.1 DUF600 family protein [Jeotgalibacillus sp. S-D1]
MEQQLDQMCPIIAEHLIGMIPDGEWYQIYLYAEILDSSREIYFYFNNCEDGDFIYSHDIPERYSVDEKIYDDLLLELQTMFFKLRQVFIEHDQEAWTNLTLTLPYPGKININYSYEDVINSKLSSTQRQMIFEYKHLGLLPQSEKNIQFVQDFLSDLDEQKKQFD